ncbi:hypothetical protein DSUL_60203 [Desulfovibrionales bacterium]
MMIQFISGYLEELFHHDMREHKIFKAVAGRDTTDMKMAIESEHIFHPVSI